MKRYAVLVDLQSERLGIEMFNKLIEEIKREGSVEYVKFYNYLAKRNSEFSTFIKEYGADIDLPMMSKKKVRIDMRQVIDAVRIASSNGNIDTFLLICSEVDGIYLINELKKAGKRIEVAVTSSNSLSSKAHTEYILDRFACVEENTVASNNNKTIREENCGKDTPEISNAKVARAKKIEAEPEAYAEKIGHSDKYEKDFRGVENGEEDIFGSIKKDRISSRTISNTSEKEIESQNDSFCEEYSDMHSENHILHGKRQLDKEAIIASLKSGKVRGEEDSIFPYSDIDTDEIDEKMAEIDRRLIKMINARKKESEESLNRLLQSDLTDKDIEELIKRHLR